jgi:hypothetical protein
VQAHRLSKKLFQNYFVFDCSKVSENSLTCRQHSTKSKSSAYSTLETESIMALTNSSIAIVNIKLNLVAAETNAFAFELTSISHSMLPTISSSTDIIAQYKDIKNKMQS